MQKHIYGLFLFFLGAGIFGQDRSLNGTVYDRSTSLPIANVNVIVEPTKVGTMTNETGQFTVDVTNKDLVTVIKGPDFPTGAILFGAEDIAEARNRKPEGKEPTP